MEDKDICHFYQQREMKPLPDVWLWMASEEEFDIWELGYKLAKDRQDC